MDLLKVTDIASKVGVVALLTAILWGGYSGVWVFGTTYKDMVAERDEWKTLALKGANLAAVAANQTIVGLRMPEPVASLPRTATKGEVAEALQHVENRTKFMSSPQED